MSSNLTHNHTDIATTASVELGIVKDAPAPSTKTSDDHDQDYFCDWFVALLGCPRIPRPPPEDMPQFSSNWFGGPYIPPSLCGLCCDEALVLYYRSLFDSFYGIIDFVSDMIYFAEVATLKVADNVASGTTIKIVLVLSSVMGLLTAFASIFWTLLSESSEDMKAREMHFLTKVRTCVQSMIQIILCLVIEHYRIQQGGISNISQVGLVNIGFSSFGMLLSNVRNVCLMDQECCAFRHILVSVFNVLPCVIVAVVLYS